MKDTSFSDGLSAGLKFWLFFMLSFALAGYPITLSIFYGALGGLAGGWIFAWWKSKEGPTQPQPIASLSFKAKFTKLSGLRLAKQKRDAKTKKQRLAVQRRKVFSSLFRKSNSSRSSRR